MIDKVLREISSHKANITEGTADSVRDEDHQVANKDVSSILLRVLGISNDRETTGMEEVACAKNA